ncbi:MAG: ABC transporter ATP-binding protein [Pseudomonadota bacterium]
MADDYVLQTRSLTRHFKGFVAVNDVNLNVRRGQIHALIGPNGAGKTTLFNLLTKFLTPSGGRIVFDGVDITREPPAQTARRGMIRSFQISSTFGTLSVLDNVRVALQRSMGWSLRFWKSGSELDKLDDRAMELLRSVGLQDFAREPASQLPYGRKRALELATTLALEPSLLLLDEPTQGMGHEDVQRVSELIRSAAHGRTVLMVEHNLSVVETLCDTITVLQRGAVLSEGSYAEVSKDPRVLEAYVGVAE